MGGWEINEVWTCNGMRCGHTSESQMPDPETGTEIEIVEARRTPRKKTEKMTMKPREFETRETVIESTMTEAETRLTPTSSY